MKKFLKISALIVCSVLTGAMCMFAVACGETEPPPTPVEKEVIPIEYTVKSINHRGDFSAPENTLTAYRMSAEKGFTMVECDVSFTKDGHAVLLHDDTIDRTSNGKGAVKDMTLDELRVLDFGTWKAPEYAGEKIPTLEEFVLLCRNLSLHPYIEMKKGATAEEAESIVDTVTKYGMDGKVTYISFEKDLLKAVAEKNPKARLGYVVNGVTAKTIEDVLALRTDENEVFVDCSFYTLNEKSIAMLIENKIPLEVWTVDDEKTLLSLDPYISGVTSNLLIAGKILREHEMNKKETESL